MKRLISTNPSNNFGAMRLLLASLVILSHTPEISDGNKSRELFHRLFGVLSFGEIAVDSFFILSGYLVCGSVIASNSIRQFIFKRIIRVVPGYVAAFLISILIFGPIAGGEMSDLVSLSYWKSKIIQLMFLAQPTLDGSFSTLKYSYLNGSMWTIQYEFACYLLLAMLMFIGLLRHRMVILGVALIFMLLGLTGIDIFVLTPFKNDPVNVASKFRLFSAFLYGVVFYLYRDVIIIRSWLVVLSIAALVLSLIFNFFPEFAFVLFGGYLLFFVAYADLGRFVSSIGVGADVSYGVYLYAWPIQCALILHLETLGLFWTNFVSVVLSFVFGYLSWRYVESKFMIYGRSLVSVRKNHLARQ